ncbi:MAG TPA: DUF5063 domain-containing protein [Bacteroidales bacterium]|nr:DUF5063 domain-containing protein [Bacteroidales bacterium]HRZ48678.1 DUF5063 domain-containing protein [Bacteroidales bacterium]
MNHSDTELTSTKVLEFLTIANEFARITEEAATYPGEHVKSFLQRILPLLYLKASLLPDVEPSDPEQNERFVTEETWENCLNRYREIFGEEDSYWDIEDSCSDEPEPVKRSLAEDLADIYQETKDFVQLYQKPLTASRENAVASCKLYFEEQWGVKALRAASRIHHILHFVHHA